MILGFKTIASGKSTRSVMRTLKQKFKKELKKNQENRWTWKINQTFIRGTKRNFKSETCIEWRVKTRKITDR